METVILDEIHALVPSKRTRSHTWRCRWSASSISCGRRLQRIGLSATQRPLEEVARFLGGAATRRRSRREATIPNQEPDPLSELSPNSTVVVYIVR